MPNIVRKVDKKTEDEIQRIIEAVCIALKLSSICVMGKFGSWQCSDARFIIVKIIKDRFDVTNKYIGKIFKRNNHLFAFQSELKCNELIKCNKNFKEKYDKALKSI